MAASPLTTADLGVPAVSTYAEQFGMFRQIAEQNILGIWDATIGVTPGLDQGAAQMWGAAVAPAVSAAQQEAVSMTQAYLEGLLSEALGRKVEATVNRKTMLANLRGGATIDDVYYRPVKTARTAMSVGATHEQASVEGRKRISRLIRTDLQLAKFQTSHAVLNDPAVGDEIKWHKRVLSGDRNCGLCMYASTRTYYKADLQPIHPGCDCLVVPQTGEKLGIVADPELLEQLKAIGATEDDVIIYRHGEYGPTLAERHHRHLPYADMKPEHRTSMDGDRFEEEAIGPRLSGYTADGWDDTGRRTLRPDWGEVLGETETPVEVASGPSILNRNDPPGEGIAYATADNRIFYVEYDEFDEDKRAAAERRLQTLLDNEARSLPTVRGGPLDGEYWTPPQAVLSISPQPTRGGAIIHADAGRGRVVHYGGSIDVETVWHENGHIVHGGVNKLGQSGLFRDKMDPDYYSTYNQPGKQWETAQSEDWKHLRNPDFLPDGDIEWERSMGSRFHPVNVGGADVDRNLFGVTNYGASAQTEDFAEAWRLAVKGEIASYRVKGTDEWVPVTFEQMFPNRYAYMQELAEQNGMELPF